MIKKLIEKFNAVEDKNDEQMALSMKNYILLAIGMVIIIAGMVLMSGSGSTEEAFNPDIFSVRRIKVAPAVCFAGFVFIIYGIMAKSKNK